MAVASARALDKFYTSDAVARHCVARACAAIESDGDCMAGKIIVEPSAGGGSFLRAFDALGLGPTVGLDLQPESEGIIEADFLHWSPSAAQPQPHIMIGNPPFGRRGWLALDFLNHALLHSQYTAFILPAIFRKWMVQQHVQKGARLLADFPLEDASFHFQGQPYAVRCCFQIWAAKGVKGDLPNRRMTGALPIHHRDFTMYQYNATPEARKWINSSWDFAVLRQGYGDYKARYTNAAQLSLKKQWIMFKADDPRIRQRLWNMDFDKLSQTNTSVRGFGKGEVVALYQELYGEAKPCDYLEHMERRAEQILANISRA